MELSQQERWHDLYHNCEHYITLNYPCWNECVKKQQKIKQKAEYHMNLTGK